VDVPAFVELSETRAWYTYSISDREGYVNNTDKLFYDPDLYPTPLKWKQIKEESVIVPAFSYAKIESMILKLCERNKQECEANGYPEEKLEKIRQRAQQWKQYRLMKEKLATDQLYESNE